VSYKTVVRIHCIILFTVVAGLTAALSSHAQLDESDFKLYSKEDGLSDNRITGMVQDQKGFLWVSTRKGLNRFDGAVFTKFLHTENKSSLPDNEIVSIRYFKNGHIGVATGAGAQIIDATTLKTCNLEVPTDTALYYWSNNFRDISLASDGQYVASTKTGAYTFSPNGRIKIRYDHYKVNDVGKAWMLYGQANNMLPDGSVLLQVENGFLRYVPSSKELIAISNTDPVLGNLVTAFTHSNILFYADGNNNFFFTNTISNELIIHNTLMRTSFHVRLPHKATEELGWKTRITQLTDTTYAMTGFSKGVYIITHHPGTNRWTLSRKFFSDRFCSFVFSDRDSRLWIGTDEGLLQEQTGKNIIQTSMAHIEGHRINSLLANKENILASCYHHRSLLILSKNDLSKQKEITISERYPEITGIFSLIPIHSDTTWIGTNAGLIWVHNSSGRFGKIVDTSPEQIVSNVDILGYFKDSQGDYWLFTNRNNTAVRYHPSQSRFSVYNSAHDDRFFNINQVFGMSEDKQGNIWISGDGLCRWNRKLQRCDTLIKYFQPVNSYKNAMCLSLIDEKDNLWFHIADNGVMKYNPFTKKFRRYTTSGGLADNSIRYIIAARHTTAALTDEGISLLNSIDETVVNYFPHDGMGNPGKYRMLYFDETTNTLYAAGEGIISTINLSDNGVAQPAPPLVIKGLTISSYDSTIHYPEGMVRLRHSSNDIAISFGSITFNESENIRYAWRFNEAGQEKWIPLGKEGQLNFNNLRPGKYLLQLKAYAANNNWKEEMKELGILIMPPWWQTTWFKLVAGILVITCIVLLYRLRISSVRKKSKLNEQLAEYEMKALHAQMNPHFVFNCLNGIKYMILHDQKENASHYLNLFSRMIRQTLEQSKQGIVSLQHEKEYLEAYLQMEELRFNQTFQYYISVDKQVDTAKIMIPAMLIQPLAENAIWHGLMNKPGDKYLHISFTKEKGQLMCTIEDNGIGMRQKDPGNLVNGHRQTGLENIRQRLSLLNKKFNLSSSMVIQDLQDGNGITGTRIKIIYPVLPE
jgi:ligand-binding sensor domain-containing protein